MTQIIRFPGHKWARCRLPHNCYGCVYCRGNLACCLTCGGAEASLPTECPGYKMSAEREREVLVEALDFVGGRWVPGRRPVVCEPVSLPYDLAEDEWS